MDQRIINLYDRFTHGGMSRREFFDRLAELAGSAAAGSAATRVRSVEPAARARSASAALGVADLAPILKARYGSPPTPRLIRS